MSNSGVAPQEDMSSHALTMHSPQHCPRRGWQAGAQHASERTCKMVRMMFVAETRKKASEHWRMARLNSCRTCICPSSILKRPHSCSKNRGGRSDASLYCPLPGLHNSIRSQQPCTHEGMTSSAYPSGSCRPGHSQSWLAPWSMRSVATWVRYPRLRASPAGAMKVAVLTLKGTS